MEENLPPLDGAAILDTAPPSEEHSPPQQQQEGSKQQRKKISLRLKPTKKPVSPAVVEEPAEQTAKSYELATALMSLVEVLGDVQGGKALTARLQATTGEKTAGDDIYDAIESEVCTIGSGLGYI